MKTEKNESIGIANRFIKEMKEQKKSDNSLMLSLSEFKLYSAEAGIDKVIEVYGWEKEIASEKKYDLIVADLPLGMNKETILINGKSYKLRRNWIQILKAMEWVSNEGLGLFITEPIVMNTLDGKSFEKALNESGYYIDGVFNMPSEILKPYTSIRPVMVSISKRKTDNLFVGEMTNEETITELVHNYIARKNAGNFYFGELLNEDQFSGFEQYELNRQIDKLETQYKEYGKQLIKDIAVEINYVRSGGQLEEKENSIYVPKIGTSKVVSCIEDLKIKHHNYFQIVLNERANNEYVVALLRSDLGKLILQSLSSGLFISHVNKSDLLNVAIPMPSIDVQNEIVGTQRKLELLKQSIESFEKELALNPISSSKIINRLNDMVGVLEGLTDADVVKNIIRKGETTNSEFKETFSVDVRKGTKEKYIETNALKTIVAFLNTEGGILLIGVNDDSEITGVDLEIEKYHKNSDKFMLHFKNNIKERIGEQNYPFIKYRLVNVDGKSVLLIECKSANEPCYLDEKAFYVRTNPATDLLEGRKMLEYVENHFKHKGR